MHSVVFMFFHLLYLLFGAGEGGFARLDVPCWEGKFSIMDFYLATCRQVEFSGYLVEDLRLIDIGKPETLAKAEGFCTGTLHSDA